MPEILLTEQEEYTETENGADKVHCANCVHCKLVRVPVGDGKHYQLRVRCTAGKWKKKLGEEKYYKYFTVARRVQNGCDSYESMADTEKESKEYLKILKKSLPIKDELYP